MSIPHVLLNHHHRDVAWETAAVTFGVLTVLLLCHAVYTIYANERKQP